MGSRINYEINDSELILYVRENNEEAKEELYKRYTPLIYKEINRVKKRAMVLGIDSSDLTQEAMVAFSHAVNNYSDDTEAKFLTFATIIIRRKLINYMAKFDTEKNRAIQATVPLDLVMDDNRAMVERLEDKHIINPLDKMITHETLGEAIKTIDSDLSDNEKLALKYEVSGKSVSEIAELMKMSTKQIYNLIHRARNKIKK